MTELEIKRIVDVGNHTLGFQYVMIRATNIQHIIDFKLMFCTFRIDFCADATIFTFAIHRLYIRLGFGIQ
jgi:hypothetical protein